MNTDLLAKVEKDYIRTDLPKINVGDTILMTTILRDTKGEKRRTQPFKGFVIAKSGSGARKSITIRKISHGIGVEKIMPLNSPNIESISIVKRGKVKQANLYYMRDRIGKKAMKLAEGDKLPEDEMDMTVEMEQEVAQEVTDEAVAEETVNEETSEVQAEEVKEETKEDTKA